MAILQEFTRMDSMGRACICTVEYDPASGNITKVVAVNNGPDDLRVTLEDSSIPRTELVHCSVWQSKTVDIAPGLVHTSTDVRFQA